MREIKVKVLQPPKETFFSYGGHDVEISHNGKTIRAFVNSKNFISCNSDEKIQSLFMSPPYTGAKSHKVASAIQLAFRSWSPEITKLTVDIAD
ncbi:hypothetical protein A7M79_01390 [Acinetobacter baumannii]|uniref:hypothetical protein n=1 Tax=Acinetobacter baumannii TaxID=470 RepID=UPI0008DC7FE4|nr:hypothetical protein [Acinetobacter baumannii]OIH12169.1 hypothetical protein A7M79_01390 [Acinetobacter baumannii]